jgi:hypothetical protein
VRFEGRHDPRLAGPVHLTQVGAVLLAHLCREGVVVVRLDLGRAADLEVAERVLQVEDEHAAGGVTSQVAHLAAGGVQRHADLAVDSQEPHLGELRAAVGRDRAQGQELGVQQVTVRLGDLGHGSTLRPPHQQQ